MSKPAARLGDNTAHGGAIVAGAPTVLIGGKPAARMSDMHTCPMVNPGVPPPPHVGGPALLGSPTVLICGQMAARMGDMVQCSGPPDSIVVGCPTVLIGESASGGGGGAGPAGAAASAAMAGNDPDSEGDHFLHVKFTDKKGKPVSGVKYKVKKPDGKEIKGTLNKEIKKTGVKSGNYEINLIGIAKPKISSSKVKVEGKVEVKAATFGIESGTPAKVEVYMKDTNSADVLYDVIETKVDNDKIEADWEFKYKDNEDGPEIGKSESEKYSMPKFYFKVRAGEDQSRSDELEVTDDLDISLNDEDGNPVAEEEYEVYLTSGEVRKGKLDKKGKAKEKDVPSKMKDKVVFPKVQKAKKIPK